jgi:hypothetical protein
MASRVCLTALALILMSCPGAPAQNGSNLKTKRIETREQCWTVILKGRLTDTFELSQCTRISGMTCHITLKDGAQLPSRVFVQALDSRGQPLGHRHLLPYPELKPNESGWTSFPSRIPYGTKTVALTGEWNGAYRPAY